MLAYITLAISSILAIIAASLNTEKDEKGENKTVLKKPNNVGVIVIILLIILAGIQFILKSEQKREQDAEIKKLEQQRECDSNNMAKLLEDSKNDSFAMAFQIAQLDSQKHQMQKQIYLSTNLIETQKFAINKSEEYNVFIKKELEKQNFKLLPLRLLFTMEVKREDMLKVDGFESLIDSIINLKNSRIAETSMNFDSSYNVSILNNEFIPERFRFATLDFGFYKTVNAEQIKSKKFQWESSLLRLRFNYLKILDFNTKFPSFETSIWYETEKSGKVMNENHQINSLLELDSLILNVDFPHCDFRIKRIVLISGEKNEERFQRLNIEEIFKGSFNAGNGKWYRIALE